MKLQITNSNGESTYNTLLHDVPFVVEVVLLLFPANTTAFHKYNIIQKHLHIAHQAGGRSRFDNATQRLHIEFKSDWRSRLTLQVYNLFVISVPHIIYQQRWVWSDSANNEAMENICILDMPATQTLRTTSNTQYHETECICN